EVRRLRGGAGAGVRAGGDAGRDGRGRVAARPLVGHLAGVHDRPFRPRRRRPGHLQLLPVRRRHEGPRGPHAVGEAAVTAVTTPTQTQAPAVEREVAFDMIRRGLPVLPLLVLVAGIGWGVNGALSGAYGVGVVLLNFAPAAALP